MNQRYFLDQDDSGHWYMIPVFKKKEWKSWLENFIDYEEDCDTTN